MNKPSLLEVLGKKDAGKLEQLDTLATRTIEEKVKFISDFWESEDV